MEISSHRTIRVYGLGPTLKGKGEVIDLKRTKVKDFCHRRRMRKIDASAVADFIFYRRKVRQKRPLYNTDQ